MHHCHRFRPAPLTRRDMLATCAGGFGAVALAALSAARNRKRVGRITCPARRTSSFSTWTAAVSQVDSFDYKPMLERYHGRDPHTVFQVEPTQFNNVGRVMMSPVAIPAARAVRTLGQRPVSAHRRRVDDLAVIRSMTSNFPEHTSANYFLHTGNGLQGRPSMGAWFSYGLGSDEPQSAGLHRPQRRPDSAGRARQFQQRLSAGGVSRLRLPARRSRRSPTFGRSKPDRDAAAASSPCCGSSTRPRRAASGTPDADRVRHRQRRDRLPHAIRRARIDGPRRRIECDARIFTASTPTYRHDADLRHAMPDRAAVGGARRPLRRIDLPHVGHDRWDQHGNLKTGPRRQRPCRRSADRRAAAAI